MVGATGGFEAQFQEFVYYAGPIIQLMYWLVMIVAALWAVVLFKRGVDFQTGAKAEETKSASSAPAAPAASAPEKPVDVDKFVE